MDLVRRVRKIERRIQNPKLNVVLPIIVVNTARNRMGISDGEVEYVMSQRRQRESMNGISRVINPENDPDLKKYRGLKI
jgi:hypothetical protein